MTGVDPGAVSGATAQMTTTSGTGSYQLGDKVQGYFTFDQAHDDGDTFRVSVDNTVDKEIVDVTYHFGNPSTLSRNVLVATTIGTTFINWPPSGQRIIRELNRGTATDVVDDDTCDMQNVDTGLAYTVILTKFDTQVIWNSTTVGTKITTIPGAVAANKGKTLDIKVNVGDNSVHNIIPTSGTIGGLSGITFNDMFCNLFIRSNADKSDWVIRCLCCYTPVLFTPPPMFCGGPLSVSSGGAWDSTIVYAYNVWNFSNLDSLDPPDSYFTATNNGAANPTVYGSITVASRKKHSGGRYYVQFKSSDMVLIWQLIGLTSDSYSFGTVSGQLGGPPGSVGLGGPFLAIQACYVNGIKIPQSDFGFAGSTWAGACFDLDVMRAWIEPCSSATGWNNDNFGVVHNPETCQGGFDISGAGSGPFRAALSEVIGHVAPITVVTADNPLDLVGRAAPPLGYVLW